MYGKHYHKMPVTSWMIPGGNRDQKNKLMREQKYPMKSAIIKNLGGSLSEVFFSCLSPSQQDCIGYTPKLQGPGEDLWVSPSNIIMGKVILTPPYTSRLRQALTHRGIMQIGAEIEEKLMKKHEVEMQIALQEKERQMMLQVDMMIREALQIDRRAQQMIYDQTLEKANSDITDSYKTVIQDLIANALLEGTRKLEEAVTNTKRELEIELCTAFKSGQESLSKQYEFQLALRENDLSEKYENQLKKHRQNCLETMERIKTEFITKLERTIASLKAEHVTDLLIQASERSQKYHEEKVHMANAFEAWFVKHLDKEIVHKDFAILELNDDIKKLKTKCERREHQIKEIFRHFQKFINFALKEKPGQAEFLLNLQNQLRKFTQEPDETEVEFISRMIIDYIMTRVQEEKDLNEIGKQIINNNEEFNNNNFREKIKYQRDSNRIMKMIGEEEKEGEEISSITKERFMRNQAASLAKLFEKNITMQGMLDLDSIRT